MTHVYSKLLATPDDIVAALTRTYDLMSGYHIEKAFARHPDLVTTLKILKHPHAMLEDVLIYPVYETVHSDLYLMKNGGWITISDSSGVHHHTTYELADLFETYGLYDDEGIAFVRKVISFLCEGTEDWPEEWTEHVDIASKHIDTINRADRR